MTKRILFLCIGLLLLVMSAFAAPVLAIENLPRPVGFVNDFAGILSEQDRASLEALLVEFEKTTSNEIVVVIVDSLQGYDRFGYSQEIFTAWEIGKKKNNNGVLMLIGPSEGLPFPERGEIFINVGRGLEGAMPDAVTGTILRKEIFPSFKAGDYVGGINKGLAAIMTATRGEYEADSDLLGDNEGGEFGPAYFWFTFILFSYLASFLGRTKSWWLGGAIGGVGGAIIGFVFWTGIFMAFSAVGFGLLGLLFDFIVSKNYAYRKAHGQSTDFLHSGGGFWFGGRGGHGGGGFGGFGGGMSGGGGAGGSW